MSYAASHTNVELCSPRLTRICIEAEQIITDSAEQAEIVHTTMRNSREPMSTFVRHSSQDRPSVVVAKPGDKYSYVPLAVATRYLKHRPRARQRVLHNHTVAGAAFNDSAVAMIFYPTFPSSFAESFSRTSSRVWQAVEELRERSGGRAVHLVPALWRPSLRFLLQAFTEAPIRPLGVLSNVSKGTTKALFEGRGSKGVWNKYDSELKAHLAQGPRCFGSAYVCDLHATIGKGLVLGTKRYQAQWRAAQRIAASVSLSAGLGVWRHEDRDSESAPLRVLFARRSGRRQLLNLDALLAACANMPSAYRCETFDFRHGLSKALSPLARADVLIAPHGGDMTNGMFLRPGASAIEMLPVWSRTRFAEYFSLVFRHQPVCLLQLFTRNASFSTARGQPGLSNKHWHTYNEDLHLPWATLHAVLSHALEGPKDPPVAQEMPLPGCTEKLVEFGHVPTLEQYKFRLAKQLVWPSLNRRGSKEPMRTGEQKGREGLYEDVVL